MSPVPFHSGLCAVPGKGKGEHSSTEPAKPGRMGGVAAEGHLSVLSAENPACQ